MGYYDSDKSQAVSLANPTVKIGRLHISEAGILVGEYTWLTWSEAETSPPNYFTPTETKALVRFGCERGLFKTLSFTVFDHNRPSELPYKITGDSALTVIEQYQNLQESYKGLTERFSLFFKTGQTQNFMVCLGLLSYPTLFDFLKSYDFGEGIELLWASVPFEMTQPLKYKISRASRRGKKRGSRGRKK